MGSVYVAAFFAFGSYVLEGSGTAGFMSKMKVSSLRPSVINRATAVAALMTHFIVSSGLILAVLFLSEQSSNSSGLASAAVRSICWQECSSSSSSWALI